MQEPQVLFENEHMIAVNKPSGLVVHPDGKSIEYTLCNWLVDKYPEIKDVGEPLKLEDQVIDRPGIVHRLDKETSGVMVIAKTQEGFTHLKHQFKNREVVKVYNAFVYGNIKDERKTIDWPIGRSKGNIRRWTVEKFARGKIREAVTQIKILDRKKIDGQTVTFIEARPQTGRTHQIRVHLNAIYHPLVCDNLYAPNKECLLELNRTALHAKEIILKDINGHELAIVAPYPVDFQRAVNLFSNS